MYYLETNSVYALPFDFILRNHHKMKTSYKSIYELISHIENQRHLEKATGQLRKIEKLVIDWDTPQNKIQKSFGVEPTQVDQVVTKKLMTLILGGCSFDTLDSEELLERSGTNLRKFRDNDGELVAEVRTANIEDIKDAKLDPEEVKNLKSIIANPEVLAAYLQVNSEMMVREYAEKIADTYQMPLLTLLQNYDGTLDVFFKFSYYLSMKSKLDGEQMHRNNVHDFHHTLYLGKEDIIITNDVGFQTLESLELGCAYSCEKLKEILR